ncbi:MAG: acyl-CoA desaturase [Saprospiraceae bacterium]|nr:acyl-CoA desaturase [Saprospiraceae bacterium]MCB9319333.1 acyl-CoA desaturase [Lewinellaceae bacterium]
MLRPVVKFVHPDEASKRFLPLLRRRVDQYFKENHLSKHWNATLVAKTIILLTAYLLPFILLLTLKPGWPVELLLWSIMGAAMAGVGMSVMHDANHGAYSSNSKVNFWLGHTLILLGGSVLNWKLQHNVLHHTYTNIVHMDDDIGDKVILRFSPHTEVNWYHRMQAVYAFFFYALSTIYWASAKDFIQFNRYRKEGVNKQNPKAARYSLIKLIFAKLFYYSIFLIIPLTVFHMPWLPYVSGFLLMHALAGLILSVIFQLAHSVNETTHPLPNDEGQIENSWAIHQLNTTSDFCRHNKWLSWYIGGLNFQIEHHLFPSISHVHYPALSVIVKRTAEEYGIPYLEHKTFRQALRSHIEALQRFGVDKNPID